MLFRSTATAEETAFLVSDVRARAERWGRDPQSLQFLPRIIPVTGATRAEAERKYEDFVDHHDEDSAAFVLKQWAGLNVDALPERGPIDLDEIQVDGLTSQHTADYLRRLSRAGTRFTKKDLLRAYAFGGEGNVQVGTGVEIADRLEEYREQTGVDGFNMAYMVRGHSVNDFVEHVVPVLRQRGLLADVGPGQTLRERLTGREPHLPGDHPAVTAHSVSAS